MALLAAVKAYAGIRRSKFSAQDFFPLIVAGVLIVGTCSLRALDEPAAESEQFGTQPELPTIEPAEEAEEASVGNENPPEEPSVTEDAPGIPQNDAGKFKRRVLLVPFINEQKDEHTQYLSVSVSDAFSAPLVQTGNFVVLNRESVSRYAKVMGVSTDELDKEENAVRLGKAVGADVVVVGRFITIGENVKIEAKAVDVQAGLLSVQDSEEILKNSTMFRSIDALARRMSGPMAQKMQPLETLPPPAEVVLTGEEIAENNRLQDQKQSVDVEKPIPGPPHPQTEIPSERRLLLDAGIGVLQVPATSSEALTYDGNYPFTALNPGAHFFLTYLASLPRWDILRSLSSFSYFVSAEYSRYAENLDVKNSAGLTMLTANPMSLQYAGLASGVARPFDVWSFTLMPFAGMSADYAVWTVSDGRTLFTGIVPGLHLGCRLSLFQWNSIEFGVNLRSVYRFMPEYNSHFSHSFAVNMGYRL